MNAAKVDGQAGQDRILRRLGQGPHDLADADGPVIMDAGLLGRFQLGLGAISNPLAGKRIISETKGTDGPGGIAVLASLAAGSVCAIQAARGFFIDVYHGGLWFIIYFGR